MEIHIHTLYLPHRYSTDILHLLQMKMKHPKQSEIKCFHIGSNIQSCTDLGKKALYFCFKLLSMYLFSLLSDEESASWYNIVLHSCNL